MAILFCRIFIGSVTMLDFVSMGTVMIEWWFELVYMPPPFPHPPHPPPKLSRVRLWYPYFRTHVRGFIHSHVAFTFLYGIRQNRLPCMFLDCAYTKWQFIMMICQSCIFLTLCMKDSYSFRYTHVYSCARVDDIRFSYNILLWTKSVWPSFSRGLCYYR